MLRKLIIALMVLSVAVLPLTATSVLPAAAAQQPASNTCGHLTLPFAGAFSGKYGSFVPGEKTSLVGTVIFNGTGFFTYCGWSKVEGGLLVSSSGRQVVSSSSSFTMTIKSATGDISFSVPVSTTFPGSNTYHIIGGTGLFARVVGGSGHFSLQRSVNGFNGTFTGHLDGTIVFA